MVASAAPLQAQEEGRVRHPDNGVIVARQFRQLFYTVSKQELTQSWTSGRCWACAMGDPSLKSGVPCSATILKTLLKSSNANIRH